MVVKTIINNYSNIERQDSVDIVDIDISAYWFVTLTTDRTKQARVAAR